MKNAYTEFTDPVLTLQYFPYNHDTAISEGVKAFADRFNCYWWLDMIASSYAVLNEEFQIWTITRYKDRSAKITAVDGLKDELFTQRISYTDFEPLQATVWVEDGILILRSEH